MTTIFIKSNTSRPDTNWILIIPMYDAGLPDDICNWLDPFAITRNKSTTYPDHWEMMFCHETGETIDGFGEWVRWTIGVVIRGEYTISQINTTV